MDSSIKLKLEKVRIWIDGKDESLGVKDTSKMECQELAFQCLRELEKELKRNIIKSQKEMYVPSNFIVFISEAKDKNILPNTHQFLEKWCCEAIYEEAKKIANELTLTHQSIGVDIKVDGTLENNDIYVKTVDNELSKKTIQSENSKVPTVNTEPKIETQKENNFPDVSLSKGTIKDNDFLSKGTIKDNDFHGAILYYLQVWKHGDERYKEYVIIKDIISIGRYDEEEKVNIALETNNQKISRKQAEIKIEKNGEIWITSTGTNPIIVTGKVLEQGSKIRITGNDEIIIYEFSLRVRPNK